MTKELLQQALDALKGADQIDVDMQNSIEAIEAAIAQPEQATAQRKRQPLTDERLRECFCATNTAEPLSEGWPGLKRFARAVEAAHGITATQGNPMTTPMPELPEARQFAEHGIGWFTAGQMQAYAIAAIEAEQGKRQPLTNARVWELRAEAKADSRTASEHWFILFARAIEAAITQPEQPDRDLQHAHTMNQFKQICKGKNCNASLVNWTHSPECVAEHDAAIGFTQSKQPEGDAKDAATIESNLWTIKEWAYFHLGAMHNITILATSAHARAATASQKGKP